MARPGAGRARRSVSTMSYAHKGTKRGALTDKVERLKASMQAKV